MSLRDGAAVSLPRVQGWVFGWSGRLRPLAARYPLLIDGLIAAAAGGSILGSSSVARAAHLTGRSYWVAAGLVVAAAAPLVMRRRWPVLAFCGSLAATATFLALGFTLGPVIQLPAFGLYSLAAFRPMRQSATACAAALVVCLTLASRGGVPASPPSVVLLVVGGWLVLPWLLGVVVRAYRMIRDELSDAARREAAYGQRLMIAREVHDVVGHGLSVINMRAGIALHVLASQPGEAQAALRAIRETSGQALRELRTTLSAFPSGEGHGPGPGLAGVPGLVQAMTTGVLTVELDVSGSPQDVPAAVDLAGYRIVQESLTNVVRHSHARRAWVHVVYATGSVRITVSDDGQGSQDMTAISGGRGVAGMRERARMFGGQVTAGSRAGGGFELSAVLPYEGGSR